MNSQINPQSGSHAIRLALLDFPDPAKAPAQEVLAKALKIWRKTGGVGAQPHIQTVYQTRHELSRHMAELTRENILAYLRSFGWEPEGQEAPAPKAKQAKSKGELPSFASVVRDAMALIQEEDRTDYVRVLAVARARWANLGGDPNTLTPVHVRNTAYHVKAKFGDLSDGSLGAYNELENARSHARGGRQPKGDSKSPPDVSETAAAMKKAFSQGSNGRLPIEDAENLLQELQDEVGTPPEPEDPWDPLRKAKKFVTEVGGLSAARELLNLLEELNA